MNKMNKLILSLSMGAALQAAPMLTTDPVDGALRGWSGATVSWSFTLTSDSEEWIAVVASFLLDETDPSLGMYSDEIGMEGGPSDGVAPPGALWMSILGRYAIDPLAPVGAMNSGTLKVLYEAFSGDPNTCGDCYLRSGEFDAPFSVTVTEIPEPATLIPLAMALCALAAHARRRAQRA